jgi:hypothetical protein
MRQPRTVERMASGGFSRVRARDARIFANVKNLSSVNPFIYFGEELSPQGERELTTGGELTAIF